MPHNLVESARLLPLECLRSLGHLPGESSRRPGLNTSISHLLRKGGFLMSSSPGTPPTESKRVLCGVLALLLGSLGVHKFVLGHVGAGIIMFILSCTGISTVIGLIEGIIYLTKSDEE